MLCDTCKVWCFRADRECEARPVIDVIASGDRDVTGHCSLMASVYRVRDSMGEVVGTCSGDCLSGMERS
jgi:hypothetical protein